MPPSPAVFPTWGAALTPGGFGRRIALAAAHCGACLDVRSVSGVGPGREGAVSGAADTADRGNVAAALCAATASNLLGMGLTPLLVGLLLGAQGGFSARGAGDIVLQLLLPFAAASLLGRGSATGRCGTRRCLVWWTGDQSY
jgi:hypothetical protein